MNINFQTLSYILGSAGMIFGLFSYFKNPQIKLEKGEGLMSMSIKQLQSDLTNLRDNHVHTLDVKLDQTIISVNHLSNEITRLSTIIEERVPKRLN